MVPDPGTYWFHPHPGLQTDRGRYAPLILADPADPGSSDGKRVVVLDDRTDGVGPSRKQISDDLRGAGGGMMGRGGMQGDGVDYVQYLVNG